MCYSGNTLFFPATHTFCTLRLALFAFTSSPGSTATSDSLPLGSTHLAEALHPGTVVLVAGTVTHLGIKLRGENA